MHEFADGLRRDAQIEWGGQAALPFPLLPAVGDHVAKILPAVKLGSGEEEHVFGVVDDLRGGEALAQPECSAA